MRRPLNNTAALLLCFLLGTGCAKEQARTIVVPDSTLAMVLVDLHLADARARLPDQPVGTRDSVLAHHGLDEETFQEAMDGLLDYPEELTRLYDSVLDQINAARNAQ